MLQPHLQLLDKLGDCAEAQAFAHTVPDLETAWNTVDRSDWMLWLLRRLKYDDVKAYRLYACWCVRNTPLADGRTVWDLLTDPRSRAAVELAERYAVGEATAEELREARSAAYAVDAGTYAYAADAAADATYAAADAAAAASYADAADARMAARKVQAQQLREMVPFSVVAGLVK